MNEVKRLEFTLHPLTINAKIFQFDDEFVISYCSEVADDSKQYKECSKYMLSKFDGDLNEKCELALEQGTHPTNSSTSLDSKEITLVFDYHAQDNKHNIQFLTFTKDGNYRANKLDNFQTRVNLFSLEQLLKFKFYMIF